MPRLLEALKSIVAGRASRTVVEEDSPAAYSAAVVLLKRVSSFIEGYVPDSIKSYLASFLGVKSQSELIFLSSILLAILLFAIILPAYETLLGDCEEMKARESEGLSASPCVPMKPSLRVYMPGVGIVELETEEALDTIVPGTCESSTKSSTRSCGSSCSMETIEESEEEYQLEEEEGKKDENEMAKRGGESSGSIGEVVEKTLFTKEDGVIDKMTEMTEKTMEIVHRKHVAMRTPTIRDRVSRRSQ